MMVVYSMFMFMAGIHTVWWGWISCQVQWIIRVN